MLTKAEGWVGGDILYFIVYITVLCIGVLTEIHPKFAQLF